MKKNLITDSWLEVSSGNQVTATRRVTISGIGHAGLRDVIAPRADFRGAIYQFLIGMLQVAFAPEGRKSWQQYWLNPPDEKTLTLAFEPYISAFNIDDAQGPAFMQDFSLQDAESKSVASLLIESPGDKTIKDNLDHFIKRDTVNAMSSYWAAVALFTLQINAPSGGVGHRVSLRGGGPLTTLVIPPENDGFDSLWHCLWLNVLTRDDFTRVHGGRELTGLSDVFPWMAATKTSENKGSETLPSQCNPLQCYWSMPRRIRLNWKTAEAGICSIDGSKSDTVVKTITAKNYGVNYSGSWQHPLSPYVLEVGKEPLSVKGQPGGIGYRHWPGTAVISDNGKKRKEPALVVVNYHASKRQWLRQIGTGQAGFNPRLWLFGYDMDNMKARCWYEATMPLYSINAEQQDDISTLAETMVDAASDVVKTLRSALKSAWFSRPKDAGGDFDFININFWAKTESRYFEILAGQIEALERDGGRCDSTLDQQWAWHLKKTAFELFDTYALCQHNESNDLKRVVNARDGKGGLSHWLNTSKPLKRLIESGQD